MFALLIVIIISITSIQSSYNLATYSFYGYCKEVCIVFYGKNLFIRNLLLVSEQKYFQILNTYQVLVMHMIGLI